MADVVVDTRWDGIAGIQRYAREVLPRLQTPWRSLNFAGDHLSPRDAFRAVPADALVYSPGYNGFIRADRQVLTLHDLIQLQTAWPGRAKYALYYNRVVRPIVRRTGAVLTVSETSRRVIERWLADDAVEVVNAGIGCSGAFHAAVDPAPHDHPTLLYVGNLRDHKNVTVVLEALVLTPDVRLRMLLPQREHDSARQLVDERRLGARVDLLAGLDDDTLAREYRGAIATVMPSTLEGFGLPALESVMTGTPVVFWRGCEAVAETVGERGIAVSSAHRAPEWSEAIRQVVSSPTRVQPPSGYDWNRTAQRIDRVLAQLS